MASTLKINTLTGVSTAGSIAVTGEGNSTTTNLQQGLNKAWCKFGSDAQPDDSFNISSGTDVATGKWRFAKTNVMNSTEYVVVVSSGYQISNFSVGFNSPSIESTADHTQSKYLESAPSFQDFHSSGGYGMHQVSGDLA